ncbi:MAG TPA: hypothetical protein VFV38_26190 [Ktedonobacteraceae bacterium]|nr:hypothetical protein [Ktedonobacteraceae bacterium]
MKIHACPNKARGLGSVTVPPHQKVGPTAETGTVPSFGSMALGYATASVPTP